MVQSYPALLIRSLFVTWALYESDIVLYYCIVLHGVCVCNAACAGAGGGAGGIPFEIWCRYYYPNVRDQVMAKVPPTILSL